MIFLWTARFLLWAFLWALKLFIPQIKVLPLFPPKAQREIPADRRCPACGTPGMDLKYGIVTPLPGEPSAISKGLLLFTCKRCGCRVATDPLTKVQGDRKVGQEEMSGPEIKGMPVA